MGVFLAIVLSIWAAMHAYVFWRLGSIPWIAAHVPWGWRLAAGLGFWGLYPLARMLRHRIPEPLAWAFEYVASNWLGILFLLFCALLVIDVFTLGGVLWRKHGGEIRGYSTLVALALSSIAMALAVRTPVVREYEVHLPGLPRERDGLVMVQVSDMHIGSLIGHQWTTRLVEQVNAMHPDVVVLVGDILDGNVDRIRPAVQALGRLKAPLGIYGVTGNHEYYAGVDHCVEVLEEFGVKMLRDHSREVVPGLVMAGVDDLTARIQFRKGDNALERALDRRPEGATILLSHSPMRVEEAAKLGVNLMLSGHTHNGQIWPFKYLVKMRYPHVSGRYDVNGMPIIVCRGTGTWGPRMRLWRPSEIVRIRLRAEPPTVSAR
jgi:predicted MPP superfamily phosphohydrolase